MKNSHAAWIYLAMLIAAAGVVIHVGAVIAGPSWFEFFNAPPQVQASAREGTWLAPVSALTIAGLMLICALYAASTVGVVRRPPLQRLGLLTISAVCLVRALILPPLAISHPELRNAFEVVSALIWGTAGVGFLLAFLSLKKGRVNARPCQLKSFWRTCRGLFQLGCHFRHALAEKARSFEIAAAWGFVWRGIGRRDRQGAAKACGPVDVSGTMFFFVCREQAGADPDLAVLHRQGPEILHGGELRYRPPHQERWRRQLVRPPPASPYGRSR